MVPSLALFLGLAIIALPLCPAQSCGHSCCPSQPQSCDMANLSSSMHCAQAPTAPAVARTAETVLVQDNGARVLTTTTIPITQQQRTLERSRLSGSRSAGSSSGLSGSATPPLRV